MYPGSNVAPMPTMPHTDLTVHPLCLGGNVFGWTADRDESFEVLDRYAAAGGNFIDLADLYAGGEAETIVGAWMADRGNRDDIVLATKLGMKDDVPGLSADNVRKASEASLERLQTDHIDLYYAHRDDPDTSLEETLGAFDALVKEGKVRHIAASNYDAARLSEAMDVAEREGLSAYVALQPHYNLMERDEFEGELRDTARDRELGVMPYFALAKGFLTGKYRAGEDVDTRRERMNAGDYGDARGQEVLRVLEDVATDRDTTMPAVALAWLAAQDTVVSPIASARTVEQLDQLLPLDGLELTNDEIDQLEAASS
jgi:aryl-alcohol dehydrogenase-like predicted oxidoreductase